MWDFIEKQEMLGSFPLPVTPGIYATGAIKDICLLCYESTLTPDHQTERDKTERSVKDAEN